MRRSEFIKVSCLGGMLSGLSCITTKKAKATEELPNVILCMADDLGWGDVAYNGHDCIKTPNLDQMAKEGVRFNRFYAAAPVCSPTRGGAITGRHPYRYGVFYANVGSMRKEEFTLAELLKSKNYATGHFGKWHLGTLTKVGRDANRGGNRHLREFSPPQNNGFDVCFSTESKVPTWNPMLKPGTNKPYGTAYWNEKGERVTKNLKGCDSRIIMDRVVPFINNASKAKKPFFAVIWFHAPHLPTVAGKKYLDMYPNLPLKARHYLGCITALDEQVGRLRKTLQDAGVADNTMLWFCSDNGPEGRAEKFHKTGSTGGLRGRKRSLYEGGIRVPGLLVWPRRVKKPMVVDMPCVVSDYLPTIMATVGFKIPGKPRPIDGINLLPILDGKMKKRPVPIAFMSSRCVAMVDNRYKIYYKKDKVSSLELYDLLKDPNEKTNIIKSQPRLATKMYEELKKWGKSCHDSFDGKDYEGEFNTKQHWKNDFNKQIFSDL